METNKAAIKTTEPSGGRERRCNAAFVDADIAVPYAKRYDPADKKNIQSSKSKTNRAHINLFTGYLDVGSR